MGGRAGGAGRCCASAPLKQALTIAFLQVFRGLGAKDRCCETWHKRIWEPRATSHFSDQPVQQSDSKKVGKVGQLGRTWVCE